MFWLKIYLFRYSHWQQAIICKYHSSFTRSSSKIYHDWHSIRNHKPDDLLHSLIRCMTIECEWVFFQLIFFGSLWFFFDYFYASIFSYSWFFLWIFLIPFSSYSSSFCAGGCFLRCAVRSIILNGENRWWIHLWWASQIDGRPEYSARIGNFFLF